MAFLQELNAPHHAEDCRGYEKQPGYDAAKKGLRIAEHRAERRYRIAYPAASRSGRGSGTVLLGGERRDSGKRYSRQTHDQPKFVPGQSGSDRGCDQEQARGPACHSQHLRV